MTDVSASGDSCVIGKRGEWTMSYGAENMNDLATSSVLVAEAEDI